MKTQSGERSGFTLVEIMIVVAIIGMLCAIIFPWYARARSNSQCKACINNMRQIESAFQQYSIENSLKDGDTIAALDLLKPYIRLNTGDEIPPCPAHGDYSLNKVGDAPAVNCSLADTVQPPHFLP